MGKKIGSPFTYNKEIGDEICLGVSTSSKGIERLCKENPDWPCFQTIYEWLIKVPSFGEEYYKAKRNQVTRLIDECIDIADDSGFDAIVNAAGNVVCNNEAINRARLRIYARQWMAERLEPKKYGQKNQTEIIDNSHQQAETRNLVEKCKKNIKKK